VAIVPEDATEEVAVEPTAAAIVDERAPAPAFDRFDVDGGEDRSDVAAADAPAIEIVPATTGLLKRARRGPRPRTGNTVAEADVAAMFDEIAPIYDRLNTVMTLGADGRWRDVAVAATGLAEGGSAIDVACGTGKLAAALAERVGPFGRVLGVDLSPAMIARAAETYRDMVQLEFVAGNALELPVDGASFDAATISFGLRNLSDFEAGFRELRRVVRPGGTVVCLELTVPRPRAWAVVYGGVFRRVAPILGGLAGHREAYRYLPTSLDGFPPPRDLAGTMRRAGLADVTWRRLALGTVAIHTGRVPSA
jgi:demethylmenaquinone methyltransferase/2-methoxy-6-polyprenyl-1,4-benzoquinol methylase